MDELALAYVRRPSRDLLDRIALAFEPHINSLSARFSRKNPVPGVLSREDFIGAGFLGLMEALKRYDPVRNDSFIAWSTRRVRGAMMDAVRRASSTSRTRDVHFVPLSEDHDPEDHDSTAEIDAVDWVLPKVSQGLHDAIVLLPDKRRAILLFRLHGLSTPEIGRLMSIKATSVRVEVEEAVSDIQRRLASTLSESRARA